MYNFIFSFSDFTFHCKFKYNETKEYFGKFPEDNKATHVYDVMIAGTDWNEISLRGLLDCPHTEYSILTPYCSDKMIPYDSVIIHAVALKWRNKAYLICANSGVGKSTQAKFLRELRPGEFGIISGDRPVLTIIQNFDAETLSLISENKEKYSFFVSPSPWNGKENWHDADAAQLAGIIFLERGNQNELSVITEREAVLPMYSHFIHTGLNEENIRKLARLEEKLLHAVPLWKLISNEVPQSTMLLLESVFA